MRFEIRLTDESDPSVNRFIYTEIDNGLITMYSNNKDTSPSQYELGIMSMGLMEYLTAHKIFNIGLHQKNMGLTSRIDENGSVTFMEGGMSDLEKHFVKIIKEETYRHPEEWSDEFFDVDIIEVE